MAASGVTVEVDVFGDTVLKRTLLRTAGRMSDATDGFREVAGILKRATQRNFATRGVSGGSRWQDLKPATIARKRRLRLDLRILRATNRLYNSLVMGGEDHIEDYGPDFLRWGSTVDYGKFHQSRKPRTKIPYRPPVRLSENARKSAVRALQNSILGRAA